MVQEEALQAISKSLIKDPMVKAIFVKGSLGRGEADEYSDIDLYCLVHEEDIEKFLEGRLEHLENYRKVLFHEDFFIIAPQLIAVFDNLLHIDLFTVTEETYIEKDYFRVIHDPNGRMNKFKQSQNLLLSQEDFEGHVYDVAWYLFQYRKAMKRGNGIWATEMLHLVLSNLSRVLLNRYHPSRAQLGIKATAFLLPSAKQQEFERILNKATPASHQQAVHQLINLLDDEMNWIVSVLTAESQAVKFLKLMRNTLKKELTYQQNTL